MHPWTCGFGRAQLIGLLVTWAAVWKALVNAQGCTVTRVNAVFSTHTHTRTQARTHTHARAHTQLHTRTPCLSASPSRRTRANTIGQSGLGSASQRCSKYLFALWGGQNTAKRTTRAENARQRVCVHLSRPPPCVSLDLDNQPDPPQLCNTGFIQRIHALSPASLPCWPLID